MISIEVAFLLVRIVIAVIFIYHAIPKLIMPAKVSHGIGFSKRMVLLLGFVELFGSIALLLRFSMHFGAILLMIVMFGALYKKIVSWKVPFSAMDKTGWEFDLILLATLYLIFIMTQIV
jgi:putative oxidoreductase